MLVRPRLSLLQLLLQRGLLLRGRVLHHGVASGDLVAHREDVGLVVVPADLRLHDGLVRGAAGELRLDRGRQRVLVVPRRLHHGEVDFLALDLLLGALAANLDLLVQATEGAGVLLAVLPLAPPLPEAPVEGPGLRGALALALRPRLALLAGVLGHLLAVAGRRGRVLGLRRRRRLLRLGLRGRAGLRLLATVLVLGLLLALVLVLGLLPGLLWLRLLGLALVRCRGGLHGRVVRRALRLLLGRRLLGGLLAGADARLGNGEDAVDVHHAVDLHVLHLRVGERQLPRASGERWGLVQVDRRELQLALAAKAHLRLGVRARVLEDDQAPAPVHELRPLRLHVLRVLPLQGNPDAAALQHGDWVQADQRREHRRLPSAAAGYRLVRVQRGAQFPATEGLAESPLHPRDPGGSAQHLDVCQVLRLHVRRAEGLGHHRLDPLRHGRAPLLEDDALHVAAEVEVLHHALGRRLRLVDAGQGLLHLRRRLLQLHASLHTGQRVRSALLCQGLGEHLHEDAVHVPPRYGPVVGLAEDGERSLLVPRDGDEEAGVSGGAERDRQRRGVVELARVVEPPGQRDGGALVEEAEALHPGDAHRVQARLPAPLREVRRDGEHYVGDLHLRPRPARGHDRGDQHREAQRRRDAPVLAAAAHLEADVPIFGLVQRTQRPEALDVDVRRVQGPADKLLQAPAGVPVVRLHLRQRGVAEKTPPAREADERGRPALGYRVLDDLHALAPHVGGEDVGGAEVDPHGGAPHETKAGGGLHAL
mmetsp:Transcript_62752/g.161498  ORF Transcript_62752/g.161498 Transcript_62752/m.161498 type:complete len:763 (+) Transcript_62752:864-3152(+)